MTLGPDQVTVPSREDPVVRSAAAVIGGPLGRYAVPLARGWRYYAALFAALTAVPMALGALERGHCVDAGWNTPRAHSSSDRLAPAAAHYAFAAPSPFD